MPKTISEASNTIGEALRKPEQIISIELLDFACYRKALRVPGENQVDGLPPALHWESKGSATIDDFCHFDVISEKILSRSESKLFYKKFWISYALHVEHIKFKNHNPVNFKFQF